MVGAATTTTLYYKYENIKQVCETDIDDTKIYRNELCFDEGTLACKELANYNLTQEEKQNIFENNAKRLLGIN